MVQLHYPRSLVVKKFVKLFFATIVAFVEPISTCRICGLRPLEPVVDLGWQALSGIFPRECNPDELLGGRLYLVRCSSPEGCGLVQLEQSFEPTIMYGENYGYRSGLNPSMVRHLESRVRDIESRIKLKSGDVVIDIGSNDGTTLSFFSDLLMRIGIDPTSDKYRKYYPTGAIAEADFFSSELSMRLSGGRLAKVVTSVAMLYDLEDPGNFVKEITKVLASDGIWMFEQSYLPLMLERVAYDTICHEHIEYYGLRQIEWLLDQSGMEVIDIELNDVNGGSFAVLAAFKSVYPISDNVSRVRESERDLWNSDSPDFIDFAANARSRAAELHSFVYAQLSLGKTFAALGASTKGNILLHYSGLTRDAISVIGEVNPDKYGCFTPGTWIPIVSEDEALERNFDYYIVLPWHFKDFFIESQKFQNKTLIFPLPIFEVLEC